MGKIAIKADVLANNKNLRDMLGDMAKPVDLNGGLVQPKTDRCGMDQATQDVIEDSLQVQFGLTEPDENY